MYEKKTNYKNSLYDKIKSKNNLRKILTPKRRLHLIYG